MWCADITYIPLAKGFLYLVAIMDWWSRKVLAWRLSNTMDVQFCVDALDDALSRHGPPEIFNTDQGSQFTSWAWTQRLREAGSRISMVATCSHSSRHFAARSRREGQSGILQHGLQVFKRIQLYVSPYSWDKPE